MPTSICCCQQCSVTFEDDFNRTNSTSIGSDWSEEVGDWSIAGSAYLTVASNNAAVICQTQVDDETRFNIWVQNQAFTQAGYTDTRVILDYVDTDNYLFIEFHGNNVNPTCGLGWIRAVRRVAGVETELQKIENFNVSRSAYSVGFGVGYFVSVRGEKIVAGSVLLDEYFVLFGETITSKNVGIGTGTIAAGETVKFDHFAHSYPDESTICCTEDNYCGERTECSCCTAAECADSIVRVVVGAGALTNDGCVQCGVMTGTFDLEFKGFRHGGCYWEYTLPVFGPFNVGPCSYYYIKAIAYSDRWEIKFDTSRCTLPPTIYFLRWTFTGAPVCATGNGAITSTAYDQTYPAARSCIQADDITLEFV